VLLRLVRLRDYTLAIARIISKHATGHPFDTGSQITCGTYHQKYRPYVRFRVNNNLPGFERESGTYHHKYRPYGRFRVLPAHFVFLFLYIENCVVRIPFHTLGVYGFRAVGAPANFVLRVVGLQAVNAGYTGHESHQIGSDNFFCFGRTYPGRG
jgi:hypothetical protein